MIRVTPGLTRPPPRSHHGWVRRASKSELNRIVLKEISPRVVLLEVTQRCDCRCVHCVRDCPDHPAPDPLSTDDWMRTIDGIAETGGIAVSFTGGEPTLRADLVDLMVHARRRGLAISLKTHGGRLDDALCRRLRAAGLLRLEVSIYGTTRASFERCTRVPGSFRRTLRGIRSARRAGIDVTAKFFAFRWNAEEAERFADWAARLSPPMPIDHDYFLIRTDFGRTFGPEVWASADQIRRLENRFPGRTTDEIRNRAAVVRTCTMGISGACVTYAGDVLPCIMLRRPVGNVRARPFAEIWRDAEAFGPFRSAASACFRACNSCAHVSNCRVCPGVLLAGTGSLYAPPPDLCRVTGEIFGGEASGPRLTPRPCAA